MDGKPQINICLDLPEPLDEKYEADYEAIL
jgi:hypothetical protein